MSSLLFSQQPQSFLFFRGTVTKIHGRRRLSLTAALAWTVSQDIDSSNNTKATFKCWSVQCPWHWLQQQHQGYIQMLIRAVSKTLTPATTPRLHSNVDPCSVTRHWLQQQHQGYIQMLIRAVSKTLTPATTPRLHSNVDPCSVQDIDSSNNTKATFKCWSVQHSYVRTIFSNDKLLPQQSPPSRNGDKFS